MNRLTDKATARPWKWVDTEDEKNDERWGHLGQDLVDSKGNQVLCSHGYDSDSIECLDQDKAFIIKAVNNYDSMLEALKEIKELIEGEIDIDNNGLPNMAMKIETIVNDLNERLKK